MATRERAESARPRGRGAGIEALLAAAGGAPNKPGVYFFLGDDREVLYIGKSANVRRRLYQHAHVRPVDGHVNGRYRCVRAVRWETIATAEEAAAREADLIVVLQPPYNGSITGEGRWRYIVVEPVEGGAALRFQLSTDRGPRGSQSYGCFPHLGRGTSSRPGVACSDGYVSLLRLLWGASADPADCAPRRICRSAPDDVTLVTGPALRPSLHAFLSGTNIRLLAQLAVALEHRPAHALPALASDRLDALRFFVYGPKAVRALRLRHGHRTAAIDRAAFEAAIRTENGSAAGRMTDELDIQPVSPDDWDDFVDLFERKGPAAASLRPGGAGARGGGSGTPKGGKPGVVAAAR